MNKLLLICAALLGILTAGLFLTGLAGDGTSPAFVISLVCTGPLSWSLLLFTLGRLSARYRFVAMDQAQNVPTRQNTHRTISPAPAKREVM